MGLRLAMPPHGGMVRAGVVVDEARPYRECDCWMLASCHALCRACNPSTGAVHQPYGPQRRTPSTGELVAAGTKEEIAENRVWMKLCATPSCVDNLVHRRRQLLDVLESRQTSGSGNA